MTEVTPGSAQSQLDKFKAAAKALDTDDDPERFKQRLGALVKAAKPVKESDTHQD